jgi:hypothetical protein
VALRWQACQRGTCQARDRLAVAARGRAARLRQPVLPGGRSHRPCERTGFTGGARGGRASGRRAGTAGDGIDRLGLSDRVNIVVVSITAWRHTPTIRWCFWIPQSIRRP